MFFFQIGLPPPQSSGSSTARTPAVVTVLVQWNYSVCCIRGLAGAQRSAFDFQPPLPPPDFCCLFTPPLLLLALWQVSRQGCSLPCVLRSSLPSTLQNTTRTPPFIIFFTSLFENEYTRHNQKLLFFFTLYEILFNLLRFINSFLSNVLSLFPTYSDSLFHCLSVRQFLCIIFPPVNSLHSSFSHFLFVMMMSQY